MELGYWFYWFLDLREITDQETGEVHLSLELIGIEPQHRRSGYAEKLIKEFERIGSARGITKLEAADIRINNKAMVLLLEKLGYQEKLEEGELSWRKVRRKEPNWIKLLIFEKYLSDRLGTQEQR